MLVIFFVALVVLGPNKLPEAARQVGRAVNEIRRISGGFQREMREAMNEPIRAAEEAKAQIVDPFGQAKSSAGTGAAGMPRAGGVTDDDPPLPSVQAAPADDDSAVDAAEAPTGTEEGESDTTPTKRAPLETTPIPTPPPPFASVTPEAATADADDRPTAESTDPDAVTEADPEDD